MAKYGSDKAELALIGGYNVNGALTNWTDKLIARTEESHTLGDSWVEVSYTGVREAEFEQEGFYDDGVLSIHEALSTGIGLSKVMVLGVEGNTTGKNFIGYNGALQIDYERILTRDELHKIKATYKGNGQVDQGKIIHPLQARTATGNTTNNAIDMLTSGTSGGAGYLQVTAFTSGPSTAIQVDLMTSPDNLTFSSWMGFTSATAAPFAERKSSTVALQRYNAVRYQGASNGASFPTSVTFFVGLARY